MALFSTNIIPSLFAFKLYWSIFCVFIYRSQCLLMAQGLSLCSFFPLSCHYTPTWTFFFPNIDSGTGVAFLIPTLFLQQIVDVICIKICTASNCRATEDWESHFVGVSEVLGQIMSYLPHRDKDVFPLVPLSVQLNKEVFTVSRFLTYIFQLHCPVFTLLCFSFALLRSFP